MIGISKFRIGNYAMFDGLVQKIETSSGLRDSDFLDPIPVSILSFNTIGITGRSEEGGRLRYFFATVKGDGIIVTFQENNFFIITEKVSGIEFPFLRWVHELQNLVEDKTKGSQPTLVGEERRTITVK
ncbi:hypothetical protein [Desertivirga arenae]|uniref:hypothetical protein n=1 Tax=Desertivirga arenae TaxID=2810309 RepID=UPI001A97BB89|nr:hypothetical protein [Pedobacter sp. SYSU D00823]